MTKDIWRSIKFNTWEEETLPSGKILLRCIFKDNYGKIYKWTPRWVDVEGLFFKSMEIEGKNESEGVWDNELKRLAEKIPYRQHDLRVFEESDAIMSEKNLKAFLYSLEVSHSYRESKSLMLEKFLYFFRYETNKYVSKRIDELSKRLCKTLDELGNFLWVSGAFFDLETKHDDQKYRLYPAYEIIVKRGVDEESYQKQRDEYVDMLYKLCESSRQAYNAYRVQIREILFR